MSTHVQFISGRVIQQENGQPVHGILVQIHAVFGTGWGAKSGCKIDFGCVLTAADGRFVLAVDPCKIPEPCRCKGPLELRMKLRDPRRNTYPQSPIESGRLWVQRHGPVRRRSV